MKNRSTIAAAILAGLLMLGVFRFQPVQAAEAEPSPFNRSTTPTPYAGFGWPGEIQCLGCASFPARVMLHHYDPRQGSFNCYTWSEEFQYCMSPTSSWIPWESVWGFGAACPMEWPIGTWIDIPGVGKYVCFDRGDLIYCNDDGLCMVDLLGPGGGAWDGKTVDVTLYVPLKPRK